MKGAGGATLAQPFQVGAWRCWGLDAGSQRLDGGAMFGVVPKPLWERRIPADDRNRIPLALRCLLIEHEAGPVLVDTGVGNKESERFKDIYGVENEGERGPTRLEDALADIGLTASDVKYVINTHLHFDHAGGNTLVAADGEVLPAFPNATYVVQRGELEFGRRRNERIAASYLAPNFEPVAAADAWRLVDGEDEVLPGLLVIPTPGHVPHHQSVVLHSEGVTACFVGDLIPTASHLPLPWIMGYDLEPLVTMESKRALLARAVAEDWLLILEHESGAGIGRVATDGKRHRFVALDSHTEGG